MKTTLIILIFAFLSIKATSQITKNNWLVGGGANFSSSKNNSDAVVNADQVLVEVSGNIGYFFIDKFVGGLKPGFESSTVKFFSGSKTSNILEIGPFIRYYFLSTESQVNILTEVAYQYGTRWATSNEVLHSGSISISSGLAVFLNTCVALEFTVGYSSLKYSKSNGSNNSVIAGIGFQLHLEKDKY